MRSPKPKEPTMKFTIYLTDDMRRALRIRAIEEGTSATKLVEKLIGDYLRKAGTRQEGGR